MIGTVVAVWLGVTLGLPLVGWVLYVLAAPLRALKRHEDSVRAEAARRTEEGA